LGKRYPAVDIGAGNSDLIYALLDDLQPAAIEERGAGLRVFFTSTDARDSAVRALASFHASPVDVDDEDWACRSQEDLRPVTVGRITVFPNPNPESRIPNPDSIALVVVPSMGFGTGHHATTRLCLAALQFVDVRGKTVLDVGTGSGVLAIAAALLGAARAAGIDSDADAIQCARDNLTRNPHAANVRFELRDLTSDRLPPGDIVIANLTGALLQRTARVLLNAARPGGTVVVSGLMAHERDAVRTAFAPATVVWEDCEGEWAAFAVKK